MHSDNRITFGAFCFDRSNECLWRGAQLIKLRPKAFRVLNQLITQPGQLVTKEQLFEAVWPETFVGDAVLKVAIRELRDALDDDPKTPEYIETAHRRGYRFIGQIAEMGPRPAKHDMLRSEIFGGALAQQTGYRSWEFVGREEALSLLKNSLQQMLAGTSQLVFVTGEAGIGKTALVDTFVSQIGANIRIGRGQCLEQYGTSEAYLPVLDAMSRLCRQSVEVVDKLRSHAPMWLAQMPSFIRASEREALNREVAGATRERMLREIAGAFEAVAADTPIVLILEDLHWSDYSTLDLISYLANQRHAARLMVIGTYRPVELTFSKHPLRAVKQELLAKQLCQELSLDYLSEEKVGAYLSLKFPANRFPPELAALIHDKTEGNPLFLVNAVDYLIAVGAIIEDESGWTLGVELERVEVGVPRSVVEMIEKQLDQLDEDEKRMLEAASVAGIEFSSLAIAAALGDDKTARCDELVRRGQFIQHRGIEELPDGESTARYGFIHALYQNVLYDRLSTAKCVQMHQRIGERGEEIYGERVTEIAPELAMHFERSRDYKRAARYLEHAAHNAIRRFAYREAVALAKRGLHLLGELPDTVEKARQELGLQLTIGLPLAATKGYAHPDVGVAYSRARELCGRLGETIELPKVLWGLWAFHMLRAELATAREIANQFLRLAENSRLLTMRGHLALEVTLLNMGDFVQCEEHFKKALSVYNRERDRDDAFLYSQDSGVAICSHVARALWLLGRPDQALRQINEALRLAHETSEPHSLAHAFYFASFVHHLRGENVKAEEYADAAIALSREHRLPLYEAMSSIIRGWVVFQRGSQSDGIEEMRKGLTEHQATGTQLTRPHYLMLLAEALRKLGRSGEALGVLDEAMELIHSRDEAHSLAEIHRIRGEILFDSALPEQAEEAFVQSLTIAKRQSAKSWELRTATSLVRLYRYRGEPLEAHDLLAQTYNSFTEGFDTADLREAKVLLEEIDSPT